MTTQLRNGFKKRLLVAIVVMGLLASGCSSNDTQPEATATSEAVTTDDTVPAATAVQPAPNETAVPADQGSEGDRDEFTACSWNTENDFFEPLAQSPQELAEQWAQITAGSDQLTEFDVSDASRTEASGKWSAAIGNYVGESAFLIGLVDEDTDQVVGLILVVDPTKPSFEPALVAMIATVLGPDAPDGAVDAVRTQSFVTKVIAEGLGGNQTQSFFGCIWDPKMINLQFDDSLFVMTVLAENTSRSSFRPMDYVRKSGQSIAQLVVVEGGGWVG